MKKRENVIGATTVALSLLSPFLVSASHGGLPPKNLAEIFHVAIEVVNALVALVIALSLLFFFWWLAQFILKVDDKAVRAKAQYLMYWGVIILFVMVSIWGIILLIANTFFP